MPEIPYDVLNLIIRMATPDTSWDEYPPPHVGYTGSPLAAAMTISHVCRDWRTEILADEALWGRLLNTLYFPKFDNLLWNLVYQRSGDKAVWLRHSDGASPDFAGCLRSNERQEYPFMSMFLDVIRNISPRRIQRLELDLWNVKILGRISSEMRDKIMHAVDNHVTHLKLGNSFHTAALAAPPTDEPHHLGCDRALISTLSEGLLELAFSHSRRDMVKDGIRRPLKHLSMHAVSIHAPILLHILRTSLELEELSLWVSCGHGRLFSRPDVSIDLGGISLPHLRMFHMESTAGMGVEPGAYDLSIDFYVVGSFKRYRCHKKLGLYAIREVEDLPRD